MVHQFLDVHTAGADCCRASHVGMDPCSFKFNSLIHLRFSLKAMR